MFDFEKYKNEIVDKIDELNTSVKTLHDDLQDEKTEKEEETPEEEKTSEEEKTTKEEESTEELEIKEVPETIQSEGLQEQILLSLDDINSNIDKLNTTNVEGYWIISLSVVLALSLKLFADQVTKW